MTDAETFSSPSFLSAAISLFFDFKKNWNGPAGLFGLTTSSAVAAGFDFESAASFV